MNLVEFQFHTTSHLLLFTCYMCYISEWMTLHVVIRAPLPVTRLSSVLSADNGNQDDWELGLGGRGRDVNMQMSIRVTFS